MSTPLFCSSPPTAMKTTAAPGRTKNPLKQTLYPPSAVANALRAVNTGMNLNKASKLFGVPRSTLWNKVNNKVPVHADHPGPVSVLPVDVEKKLCNYILNLIRKGFPLDTDAIADSVQKIVVALNLETPFTKCRPSRKWFEGFLRRFPEISVKEAEHLRAHPSEVTEGVDGFWHSEVLELFQEDNIDTSILRDSSRVWNCDELAISAKGETILGPRGESNSNSNKDCVTILFNINAKGDMAPTFALFPYGRISTNISQNCPRGWRLGTSEKGTMTGESLFEYIGNIFLPHMQENNIPRPIVLFLDRHKSHITMHLNDLCDEEGIILIALQPNASAIRQPLDVSIHSLLRTHWQAIAEQWRVCNGEEINLTTLCTAMDLAVRAAQLEESIRSGFQESALFPFGGNIKDYKKYSKKSTEVPRKPVIEPRKPRQSHIEYLEGKIDPSILDDFKVSYGINNKWTGDPRAAMLYEIWKQCVEDEEMINDGLPSTSTR